MNKQILALTVLVMFTGSAMADVVQKKAVTRIDFNKMIDENNSERADLQREIVTKDQDKATVKDDTASAADKQKVYDFVDMEVGSGKARPIVDRRFNSSGKPRVVQIEKSEMTVQLVAKRK